MKDMKKTTIYLPVEVVLAVKAIFRQDHRSEAEIIREALGEYLAQRRRPMPRSFGMVADGSFNAGDDEKYLAEHWKQPLQQEGSPTRDGQGSRP